MIVVHFRFVTGTSITAILSYDHSYNILGVIDWENACTVPWELVGFPPFIAMLPYPMDAPWNYNENGEPIDADTRQGLKEQKEYAQRVGRFERKELMDDKLSPILKDQDRQGLAYAMSAWPGGKMGFYHAILDPFSDKTN